MTVGVRVVPGRPCVAVCAVVGDVVVGGGVPSVAAIDVAVAVVVVVIVV